MPSSRSGRAASEAPFIPPRLAEGGGTAFERRLVRSAAADGMPDAVTQARAAAALRAALARPMDAAAPVPPASASAGGLGRASKWIGAGLIGMAVLGGLARIRPSTPPPTEPAPSGAALAPLGAVDAPEPARANEPRVTAAPLSRRSDPSDGEHPGVHRSRARSGGSSAAARSVARSVAPHAPALNPSEGPGLAAEIRAIESIQGLVGWGQAQHARRALADYRRRFPQGELALEADLLEVDVAVLAGDRPHAQALARELLARPAAGRYRARLDALLAPGGAASIAGSKSAPAQMDGRR